MALPLIIIIGSHTDVFELDFPNRCEPKLSIPTCYTLSEAWSGVNWADLRAPLGPIFMTGLPER